MNLSPEEVRRFTFSFPARQNNADSASEERRHILLVEDNPGDVGLIREALNEHRIECTLVAIADGERAFKFFDDVDNGSEPIPDLILLDLNLPKRPGKEVLKRIKVSEKCSKVPTVVLTSSDNQRDKDDVAAFKPARYIRKPSKLDDFVRLGLVFKEILYGARE